MAGFALRRVLRLNGQPRADITNVMKAWIKSSGQCQDHTKRLSGFPQTDVRPVLASGTDVSLFDLGQSEIDPIARTKRLRAYRIWPTGQYENKVPEVSVRVQHEPHKKHHELEQFQIMERQRITFRVVAILAILQ